MPSCFSASIIPGFAPTSFHDSRAKKSCFKPVSLRPRPRPLCCCGLALSPRPPPEGPDPEAGLLYSLLSLLCCFPSLPKSFPPLPLPLCLLWLVVAAAAAATERLCAVRGSAHATRVLPCLLCQLQVIECAFIIVRELCGGWSALLGAADARTLHAPCGGAGRLRFTLQQSKQHQ